MLIGQAIFILIAADCIVALGGDFHGNGQFRDRATLPRADLAIRAGPFESRIVPGIENLQENPLRPAIVIGIGRGKLTAPVVAEAKHLQLPSEIVDVFVSLNSRMSSGLNGIFFGGQSKGIPAHGMEDFFAQHPGIAADDIGGRVTFRVPDVQSFPGRIGKHVQNV